MEDTSDLEKTLEYRPAASVRPVSLDEALRRRRTIQSGTVALVLLAGLSVVGAVVVRVGVSSPSSPARSASFARESSRSAAASPASSTTPSTDEVPTVDVASLPHPPIGTVIGAPKHRLWIDGHLAQGWKRTVKCGEHVVQVGSQGEERTVNVPCGGEVNVAP